MIPARSHRIVVTSPPSAAAVARFHVLTRMMALTAVGQAALARGAYNPAEVSRETAAFADRLIAVVTRKEPTTEAEARVLLSVVKVSGARAHVEYDPALDDAANIVRVQTVRAS